MRPTPTILVLAAGQGSRFQGAQHKLGQALGAGSVLGATVRRAIETRLPVAVVTVERHVPLVADQLATCDIVVVGEAQARRGMGHTIAAGVSERPDAAGWLVLPGDMPLVRSSTIAAVAAALLTHTVAYAQHRGRRGHPVGFGAELYSDLVRLEGDEGARRIIARYPAHAVEVDDPGVLADVDTLQDLQAVREAYDRA